MAKDKGGTSDPFAKVSLRIGRDEQKHKTTVLPKTLNPVWNQMLPPFKNVLDEGAELRVALWDDDLRGKAEPLGEIRLVLKDIQGLARDGTWLVLPPATLSPVKVSPFSGIKQKVAAQGTVEVMLSWIGPQPRPLSMRQQAILSKKNSSKALVMPSSPGGASARGSSAGSPVDGTSDGSSPSSPNTKARSGSRFGGFGKKKT